MSDNEEEIVTKFREYLKIPTAHPNVNYEPCVEFFKNEANCLGLPISVHYFSPSKPIIIISWEGNEPHLPSLMLSSHMDVVPVVQEKWNYDPFGAEKDSDGNIYARGSQDMKSVSIQYLEAVRRLKSDGILLKRTIHLVFVPDEEIGAIEGMRQFVHTSAFKQLNVGCALDEGRPSLDENFHVFYGERCNCKVTITCTGPPSHGCVMLKETSGGKAQVILNRFMEFRSNELLKASNAEIVLDGQPTTVNLTIIKGGIHENIVPHEILLLFDIRIAIDVDYTEFEEKIHEWCREAGDGVSAKFRKDNHGKLSRTDDDDPWWAAIKSTSDLFQVELIPEICPGSTDARFVREKGIPAYGFSPLFKTPFLCHEDDECLNEKIFLKGIDVYLELIKSLANVEEEGDSETAL